MNAFQPLGMVPVGLQCWPHSSTDGSLRSCKNEPVVVLEDFATGWPGTCQGLTLINLPSGLDCATSCYNKVSCASFQVVNANSGTQCYQGVGTNCYDSNTKAKVVSAQRLLRGHFRVLKDLKGWQAIGLVQAFGANVFSTNELAVSACNKTCLSLVTCEVWTYSTQNGCWYNNPDSGSVQYPPTNSIGSFTKMNPAYASSVITGSYIQRQCQVSVNPDGDKVTLVGSSAATVVADAKPAPAPLAPATASSLSQNGFVVTPTGYTYYVEVKNNTKHLLRNIACNSCGNTGDGPGSCSSPAQYSQALVDAFSTGQDFSCSMFVSPPATQVQASQGSNWVWNVLLVLGVISAILAVGLIAYFCCAKRRLAGKRATSLELSDDEDDEDPMQASMLSGSSSNYSSYTPMRSSSQPALPMSTPHFGAKQQQEYDLVTVTPHGYHVSPLQTSTPAAQAQEYDLVTVTPFGYEVSPLAPTVPAMNPRY